MLSRIEFAAGLVGIATIATVGCGPRHTRVVSAPTREESSTPSVVVARRDAPRGTSQTGRRDAPGATLQPGATASSSEPALEPHGCTPGVRARGADEHGFYVANDGGIREVASDGAVLRTLTTTPADRARFTVDHRALVFLATGAAQVRRIDLESCGESVVTALPRGVSSQCGGIFQPGYDPTTFVQSDGDARITADGSALCLRVLDRNENMMSVEIHMRVPLSGGDIETATVTSESCGSMTDAQRDALPCAATFRAVTPRHAPADTPFPFALREHEIVRGGRVVATLGDEAGVEQTSPSGRWVVFSTNIEEGDYIYRDLYAFDRTNGQVLPLTNHPRPMTRAQLRSVRSLHEFTINAAGETPIRFTGNGDELLVEHFLVVPGVSRVDLEGRIAE